MRIIKFIVRNFTVNRIRVPTTDIQSEGMSCFLTSRGKINSGKALQLLQFENCRVKGSYCAVLIKIYISGSLVNDEKRILLM